MTPGWPAVDWLRWRAAHTPEREALRYQDRSWSFADLDREASLLARRLAALGLGQGDRLALLLASGPLFVQAVHAVGRVGATLVPLNTRLAVPELYWQLEDVGARLMLHDESTAPLAAPLATRMPELTVVDEHRLQATTPAEALPRIPFDPGRVHTIIYTSGTTGRPKGAQLTYGNYGWSALASALNLGLSPSDRWLAPMPLFHVGGLSILFRTVIYGIPALLQPRFDPEAVHQTIDQDGVTLISVVSAMLSRMLEARGERPYPSSLRAVLLGGGPAPRPLLEAAARLGMPVAPTYGLTEAASQVATLAPDEAFNRLGSAGRPLFGVELRIVDERDRDLPPGRAGEILVRGPNVMAGYYRRPEETARALVDGWLHTGDLGYLDREGYLYVLDRRDDLIVSGGENVYPAEVEAALLQHPAVLEAGVTGVSDPRWGQAVLAAVRLRPGAEVSEDELQRFCRERLAGYKVPSQVRFVASLPRNAAGKLVRRRLSEAPS